MFSWRCWFQGTLSLNTFNNNHAILQVTTTNRHLKHDVIVSTQFLQECTNEYSRVPTIQYSRTHRDYSFTESTTLSDPNCSFCSLKQYHAARINPLDRITPGIDNHILSEKQSEETGWKQVREWIRGRYWHITFWPMHNNLAHLSIDIFERMAQ